LDLVPRTVERLQIAVAVGVAIEIAIEIGLSAALLRRGNRVAGPPSRLPVPLAIGIGPATS
jgi:hypothetical protein